MDSENLWLFPKEFVEQKRQEKFRVKTIWFLQDLGKSLSFDQVVKSTAAVYLHRFYLFHTFKLHDRFMVALACLFLASKVEERAIKVKDIVVAYYNLVKTRDPNPEELEKTIKEVIIKERILLNTLNFDLSVLHPYEFCQRKVKNLRGYFAENEVVKELLASMYSIINDSYYTTVCLEYAPKDIAMAAFYIATVQLCVSPSTPNLTRGVSHSFAQQSLQSNNSWIDLLESEITPFHLREITLEILSLYDQREHILNDRDRILSEIFGSNVNTVSTSNTPNLTIQNAVVENAEALVLEKEFKPSLSCSVDSDSRFPEFPSSSKGLVSLPTSASKTPMLVGGAVSPSCSISRDGSESVMSYATGCGDWDTPLHSSYQYNSNETPCGYEGATPRYSRDRSNSLNDYAYSVVDFKKQRME